VASLSVVRTTSNRAVTATSKGRKVGRITIDGGATVNFSKHLLVFPIASGLLLEIRDWAGGEDLVASLKDALVWGGVAFLLLAVGFAIAFGTKTTLAYFRQRL